MTNTTRTKSLTYEAWRISFQSSEGAARAAFTRIAELEAQAAAKCLGLVAEPGHASKTVDIIMDLAQVFASSSLLAAGRFSTEKNLNDAHEAKANLCAYVTCALQAAPPAQAAVAVPDEQTAFEDWRSIQPYQGATERQEKAFRDGHRAALAAAPAQEHAAQLAVPGQFQQRVQPWLLECFGAEIACDRDERNHRFLEESIELVQSRGCTASEAHQLVDYVFARPVGEPVQEVGGVMVTLAALCYANGLDMHAAGETELERIGVPAIMAKIKAKQAAKPKHSPLPAAPAQAQDVQQEAGLPTWWPDFIQNVAELPDRNSPEDEPDAMIATADELGACAMDAINFARAAKGGA